MDVRTFTASDKKSCLLYETFLLSCPNSVVQQTLAWSNVITDMDRDQAFFCMVVDRNQVIGVLPLYVYKHPLGNILTSVPYPGPLGGVAASQKNNAIYAALLDSMEEVSKKNECVAATIITSPFAQDIEIYRKVMRIDYEMENFTQCVDLQQPLLFSHGIRNKLHKNIGELEIFESNEREVIEKWWNIHRKRMSELGADPIPLELFHAISTHLVPHHARFFFITSAGTLIGGCLYIFHRDILDVYMLSCDSDYQKISPATHLTNHTIRWAKENGFRVYNFQSSKRKGDGVYQFKAQWGAKEVPYFFLTKTFRPLGKLIGKPLSDIRRAYQWHYLAPFSLWDNHASVKNSPL